jgi:predicted AlkP superfamily phosphohydrolase/phosphomutase
MQNDPCSLTAILLDGPDKLFHICWRFIDPEYFPKSPSAWEKKIRELCLAYFRKVDSYLEEVVRLAGKGAYVFLVSDHGFKASTEVFRVNVWLAQKGYLTWRVPPAFANQAEKESWERRMNCNFVLLDWEKTRVYAPTSSANGLYIRVARHPGQSGVPADEYDSFRNRLIEQLYEVVNPDTGERVVMQALKREEIYRGPHVQRAPDLTLVLRDSGFISINNREPVVESRAEVWGTHEKNGVFVGHGPGLKEGMRANPLSILDIAPLTLYSLGLEIPRDFEGRVPVEILKPSWITKHPIRAGVDNSMAPSYQPEPAVAANAIHQEENADIIRRMKQMGYIA